MLPETRSFLIRGEDGQEYGPVELEELREWVQENRAGLGTEVRTDESGSAWQAWQQFPELVALLAEVRVTSPIPGQPGLVIAPIGKRMIACALDVILSTIWTVPVLIALALVFLPDWCVQYGIVVGQAQDTYPVVPPLPPGCQLIGGLLSQAIMVCYMAGFYAAHGRTPAKSMMRLRVVDENGRKPSLGKSLLRGLTFVVSFKILLGLPFFYVFFNPQRRAFHDFVAGTYVVEA